MKEASHAIFVTYDGTSRIIQHTFFFYFSPRSHSRQCLPMLFTEPLTRQKIIRPTIMITTFIATSSINNWYENALKCWSGSRRGQYTRVGRKTDWSDLGIFSSKRRNKMWRRSLTTFNLIFKVLRVAVSASRLVKSPDSHASDPCSRLGGSSWLCYEIFISEFNEMREEKFLLAPPCVKSGKLAVRGWTLLQSTWPCSIYEDILQSSTKLSVVHPSTVGKIGSHWPWSESRRVGSSLW